ncbi:MAG: PhoU domain-containing protein [Microthrixaceae bacterium]
MSRSIRSCAGLIEDMGLEAATLTRKAIDAYIDSDEALASALDDIDDRLDDLQVDFVEAIFEHHVDGLELRVPCSSR